MFMKYSTDGTVSPAYDVMEFLPLAFMMLSWACFKCQVNVLPDFKPNDYLFQHHSDKANKNWEIYAWAIRDLMCKHG